MRRALLLCSITATTAWNLDLKVRDNTTVALSWNAAPAAARNYSVYRTFGISSRPHEWLLVTKTIAAPGAPGCTAQSSGLLANTTYTFRVCTQQSCSNNASVAMPRGPHGARGAVVMAASARFPRCGEGTVVRFDARSLKKLYLQDVLVHEIGHHADRANLGNTKDNEAFARWFATEFGFRLPRQRRRGRK